MNAARLPAAFVDLTPFLDDWALPSADERQARRRSATRAQLRAFYDAMLPRIAAILTELDTHPLGALPQSLHALYYLALSLAEVAPHIELYGGSPAVPYAFEETRFVAAHGAQDSALGLSPAAR